MSYPGGKNGAGVYQRIISLMPPHDVYIEPFLGGAAVMRLKRPARLNIGIDLVAPSELPLRALNVGNVVEDLSVENGVAGSLIVNDDGARRRRPAGMAMSAALAETDGTRVPPELTIAAGSAENGDGPPASERTIAAGSARSDDGRRRPPSERAIPPAFSPVSAMGPGFEFRQTDGIEFLKRYPFQGRELVYCDPPYLMETRSGRRLYEFEMSSCSHRRLLRAIRKLPCMVMISGYRSEMYEDALAGWNVETYQAMTRGGTARTEYLWFNFPRPTALHDYRYLGSGFRERERIKRKKARWTARLKRLPLLERQALLSAIADIVF